MGNTNTAITLTNFFRSSVTKTGTLPVSSWQHNKPPLFFTASLPAAKDCFRQDAEMKALLAPFMCLSLEKLDHQHKLAE